MEKKTYKEFKAKLFTSENLITLLMSILFGSFAYHGNPVIIAVWFGLLYFGSFVISDRINANKENIEALHEEIEDLKKQLENINRIKNETD